MEDGRHSYMAESSAYLRAVHMSLDGEPKILDDPLAAWLLEAELEENIAADRERLLTDALVKARSLIVMRSRFAEDEMAVSLNRGVRQYVILGAGLDTSAYRNGNLVDQLQVYEVDHPDTQKLKLERLAGANIPMHENIRHVAVDFEQQSMADGLAEAGFDRDLPTFFSWLGVSYYLNRESVLDVFKYVAGGAPHSQLIFDFMLADSVLGEKERKALAKITAFLEKYREPLICRFEPLELQDTLYRIGFDQAFHLTWEAAMARYFENRPDGMYLDPTTQIMSAIV